MIQNSKHIPSLTTFGSSGEDGVFRSSGEDGDFWGPLKNPIVAVGCYQEAWVKKDFPRAPSTIPGLAQALGQLLRAGQPQRRVSGDLGLMV